MHHLHQRAIGSFGVPMKEGVSDKGFVNINFAFIHIGFAS
jgi:hypothetical protein